MSRALLITGATGKQGGAVIKALLANNADFHVLAVTRDAASISAKKLAAKSPNITLVQGDLNDTDSIFKNAKNATSVPIWGVFSVQAASFDKNGPIIEQRQGISLVDSALKNGVKHFVYSSVDRHGAKSIENPTNVPHFVSRHHIEHHLIDSTKGTNMSWTILRPVAFMENFDGGFMGKVIATMWDIVLKSRSLQLIATDDIGIFAAKSFMDLDTYKEQCISLAGDELTYEQMAKVFEDKTGSQVPRTWNIVARLILWISKDLRTMYEFFKTEGYAADIKELRKVHPGLMDLQTWLDGTAYAQKRR